MQRWGAGCRPVRGSGTVLSHAPMLQRNAPSAHVYAFTLEAGNLWTRDGNIAFQRPPKLAITLFTSRRATNQRTACYSISHATRDKPAILIASGAFMLLTAECTRFEDWRYATASRRCISRPLMLRNHTCIIMLVARYASNYYGAHDIP